MEIDVIQLWKPFPEFPNSPGKEDQVPHFIAGRNEVQSAYKTHLRTQLLHITHTGPQVPWVSFEGFLHITKVHKSGLAGACRAAPVNVKRLQFPLTVV